MKVGDTVSLTRPLKTFSGETIQRGSWGDVIALKSSLALIVVKFRCFRQEIHVCEDALKLETPAEENEMMAEYAAQGGFEPDEHAAPLPNTVEGFVVPDYYGGRDNPYEVFKVIRAWELGFFLGNALKYIKRWNLKGDPIENLKKAREYITNEIEDLEAKRGK